MLVTREWLDSVSDKSGLTKGQQQLLTRHLGGVPYVGKLLDDGIAAHVEKCRGWRLKGRVEFTEDFPLLSLEGAPDRD